MTRNGKLAWGFVLLVAVLHCDFWWWDTTAVVLGFLPLTLASQIAITLAASAAWALVVRHAWPRDVEEWASELPGTEPRPAARDPRQGGAQ